MDYFELNKQTWDQRVKTHVASEFYDVDGFLAGKSSLQEIELNELGDVDGKRLLHLQCHFGSWQAKIPYFIRKTRYYNRKFDIVKLNNRLFNTYFEYPLLYIK